MTRISNHTEEYKVKSKSQMIHFHFPEVHCFLHTLPEIFCAYKIMCKPNGLFMYYIHILIRWFDDPQISQEVKHHHFQRFFSSRYCPF